MKKGLKGFDTVIGLLINCVFVTVMLFALSSAAGTYKEIGSKMEEQYTIRTALGYLSAKVRQSDTAGAVSLTRLGSTQALLLREEIDGEAYETYIYCFEGQIRELFSQAGASLEPGDGMAVIPADSLDFSMEGGLIRIVCRASEKTGEEYVCVNSREGVGS